MNMRKVAATPEAIKGTRPTLIELGRELYWTLYQEQLLAGENNPDLMSYGEDVAVGGSLALVGFGVGIAIGGPLGGAVGAFIGAVGGAVWSGINKFGHFQEKKYKTWADEARRNQDWIAKHGYPPTPIEILIKSALE